VIEVGYTPPAEEGHITLKGRLKTKPTEFELAFAYMTIEDATELYIELREALVKAGAIAPQTKRRKGLCITGIGGIYPTVYNDDDRPMRIEFDLGDGTMKHVDVQPREIAPFHTRGGVFKADFIREAP
jgi:hypothetical protein